MDTIDNYPSLLKRIQSTLADNIIAFALAGLLVSVANDINEDSIGLKIAAIVIAFSYEPIMNRYFRTVGQILTGTRVKYMQEGRKLPLPQAYLRFILKTALGWLSFLTVYTTPGRRAMHDLAANTIVVYNK